MIVTKKALSRRAVLRGMGVTLALPLLDGMIPAFAGVRSADDRDKAAAHGRGAGHAESLRNKASAANCSAARRVPAVPIASLAPTLTVTTNSGACGGPDRPEIS